MSTQQQLTIQGLLAYPPDLGLQPQQIPFNLSASFTNYEGGSPQTLIGSGTKAWDLGTPPAGGLKALLIKVDQVSPTSGSPAPVQALLNGALTGPEISPGGFLLLASPSPVAGITSLSIAHTTDVNVRVWALG